jgi:hypothetical protein
MGEAAVLIHVRFSADGTVTEIGERPAAAPRQGWFDLLSDRIGESYQPLSGGRAVFRVARETLDGLKAGYAGG